MSKIVAVAALLARAAGPSDLPTTPPASEASPDTVVVTGERGAMSDVAFSPDGRQVASGSLEGRVYIWDADTGELLHELEAHRDEAYAVAYSPDGSELLVGEVDGDVVVHPLYGGPADTLTGQSGDPGGLSRDRGYTHERYRRLADVGVSRLRLLIRRSWVRAPPVTSSRFPSCVRRG